MTVEGGSWMKSGREEILSPTQALNGAARMIAPDDLRTDSPADAAARHDTPD